MACGECPICGWMGNESVCPECGFTCVWDEAHSYADGRDESLYDEGGDEEEEEE